MNLLAQSQSRKDLTVNEALLQLDTVVQMSFPELETNDPPIEQPEGASYLVGRNPTGNWENFPGTIAIWIRKKWKHITPKTGWLAYIELNNGVFVYNGTIWVALADQDISAVTSDDIREGGILYPGDQENIVNALTPTDGISCRVHGEDTSRSDHTTSFLLALECDGETATAGTGLLDGVLTLNNDTPFTWNGQIFSSDTRTPSSHLLTRMPDDGANDAMTQHWLIEGAVFDFTKTAVIGISASLIGPNFTGVTSSFEGTLRYALDSEGVASPDVIPDGQGVAPVNTLIADYLENNDISGGGTGEKGDDGLNAFETYKVLNNQPDLTFEQYKAAIKGDKGDKGDKGNDGAASTVPGPKGDKGDTGPASTVAGPKGAKGDKGDKGDTGNDGPQGPAGGGVSTASPFGADTLFRQFDVELTGSESKNITDIVPKGFYIVGASAVVVTTGEFVWAALNLNNIGDTMEDELNFFYSPEVANSPGEYNEADRAGNVVGSIARTAYNFNPTSQTLNIGGTIRIASGGTGTYRAAIHCLEMCPPNLPVTE